MSEQTKHLGYAHNMIVQTALGMKKNKTMCLDRPRHHVSPLSDITAIVYAS